MTRIVDLDEMPPAEKDEWAHLLRSEAARERRVLTVDAARAAVACAPLSDFAERAQFRDLLAVRAATCCLLERRWRVEQIVDVLVEVASETMPDREICRMAVAGGIHDFRSRRGE